MATRAGSVGGGRFSVLLMVTALAGLASVPSATPGVATAPTGLAPAAPAASASPGWASEASEASESLASESPASESLASESLASESLASESLALGSLASEPAASARGDAETAETGDVPEVPEVEGLDLRAGPVATAMQLRMPSVGVSVAVLGVGLTSANEMHAPTGRPDDPVWRQAFWYRGSAVPGDGSTALLAGHSTDSLGRRAAFGRLDQLQRGDPLVVHDSRAGRDLRFTVTETATYSLAQAGTPVVLARIYGNGPVAGTGPQPSVDGLAHLTLITCSGTFRRGTHDHRFVVYATRSVGAPGTQPEEQA